jgi:hypothetical protein
MKIQPVALAAMLTAPLALSFSPAHAQVVIDEGRGSYADREDNGVEGDFLRRWNRHHDAENAWGYGGFGPEDVIRLLERRGYQVDDVRDVGPRYLVRARRDGDDLLVSVSRQGEIMGVVHDRQ